MIVTRKWLEEFIDLEDISTKNILQALNSLGLEVESFKNIKIADGVVVGKVIKCEKHPNADKLNICQVDIGKEIVQIVCGAKNVKANQFVPVATVGTELNKDFIIKKANLRGIQSNGMICSSTEIGLPFINDGILELDSSVGELVIGKSLNEYDLLNDDIIEIELTANRGDCLSIFGVAKEISVYFDKNISIPEFKISETNSAIGRVLEVEIEDNNEFNLIYKIADIANFKLSLLYKIRASLIDRLKNSDIETLTEYALHTTGVILNLYTKKIANNGEKIKLIIKNNKKGLSEVHGIKPLSIIGIEKGEIEKIDDIVIFEASYINPAILAKKVFQTKQKTGDIYYKTSRGSNPDLEFGLDYLLDKLSALNGMVYKGEIEFINDIDEIKIDVNLNKLNAIIGQNITLSQIEHILVKLGFRVSVLEKDDISVTVPIQRHDIVNIADVAEEIVRIIGIGNINSTPFCFSEKNRANTTSVFLDNKNIIRANSVNQGFFETVTYLFSPKELLKRFGFEIVKDRLDIANPITNELNSFRTTLLINLLRGVKHNNSFGYKYIPLFEIGKVFDKNRNEKNVISFVMSGDKEYEGLKNSGKPKKIDFFTFASKIVNIIGEFELEKKVIKNSIFFHPYQFANIIQNNQKIGIISKINPIIAGELDISEDSFVCEIEFDKLDFSKKIAQNISKYQVIKRDLSLVVPKELEYKQIIDAIKDLSIDDIKQFNLIDIYNDKELGEFVSLTIRFTIQSDIKTLVDEEINNIIDKIIKTLDDKLKIRLR